MFSRQHSATVVSELSGATIEQLLAVEICDGGYSVFYMQVRSSWTRITIDEGVLFASPIGDPREDMGDCETISDLLDELGVRACRCEHAEFKDGAFALFLAGRAAKKLVLSEGKDGEIGVDCSED